MSTSEMDHNLNSAWAQFVETHQIDDVVLGLVTRVENTSRYTGSASIKIGEIDAILDKSNLCSGRGPFLPEEGEQIYCPILRIDAQAKKVELGQPIYNWLEMQAFKQRVATGTQLRSTVVTVCELAVFLELAPKVLGVLEIEAMPWQCHASDMRRFFSEGQVVDVFVLRVRSSQVSVGFVGISTSRPISRSECF